jgi:hypothetical protein
MLYIVHGWYKKEMSEYYTFEDVRANVLDAVDCIAGHYSSGKAANLQSEIYIHLAHRQAHNTTVYISAHEDDTPAGHLHIGVLGNRTPSIIINKKVKNTVIANNVMKILATHGCGVQSIRILHNNTSVYVLPPIEKTEQACSICNTGKTRKEGTMRLRAQAHLPANVRYLTYELTGRR